MITTTLTWYSVEEKLPDVDDNIAFITKENSDSLLHLLIGYYSKCNKQFIEEDKNLNDVSFWKHEDVAYWAVVDYSNLYNKFDYKLLGVETWLLNPYPYSKQKNNNAKSTTGKWNSNNSFWWRNKI